MKHLPGIILFLLFFFTIWGVEIVNRTEAEDAYDYSLIAEQGAPQRLYHSHHLLYGALAKDAYVASRALGYTGRAYGVLRLLSALSGAGALMLFYKFCVRVLKLAPLAALPGVLLLLFSYGFWRYANEVEIIAPASILAMLILYLAFVYPRTPLDFALLGVLGAGAFLLHILNGIPVFMAVPLALLLKKSYKGLIIYVSVAALISAGTYLAVALLEPDQLHIAGGVGPRIGLMKPVRGVIGIGAAIVAGNFTLGYSFLRGLLPEIFPARMLLEEIYMGEAMPLWMTVAGTATFSALALSAALFALKSFDKRRLLHSVKSTNPLRPAIAAVAVWAATYALTILLLEPGNPEVWVQGLLPIFLLITYFCVDSLYKRNRLWVAALFVACMAAHNYVGGMLPLRDADGDYNRAKAEWILSVATPEDLIITAANPVFERYLRYYSPARVEYLYDWTEQQLLEPFFGLPENEVFETRGRIFITGDVFEQPASLRVRFSAKTDQIDVFAATIKPLSRLAHENDFGGVYILEIGEEP